jgi:peptide subunit release factor 1 (eRF1)
MSEETEMITKHELDFLTNYPPAEAPVVSFFLSLDRREPGQDKVTFTELKNLLKSGQEEIARWPEPFRIPLTLHLARIEETVEDERGGKTRGLAVFAGQNLWQVHRLPLAPGNQIIIARTPHVKPLIHLFRRNPRYCAVLVDKERARLFLIQMGEIQDYSLVLDEVPKHHDQGGWAQARLQRRHDDFVSHHLKRSAELTFEFFQREGFDYLLIGGTEELTSAFFDRLHTYLQDRVAGYLPISTSASPTDVRKQTLEAMEGIKAQLDEDLTARLKEQVGSGNLAVAGLAPTLRALNAHKVMHLLVEEGYQTAGGRCPECGTLRVRSTGRCRFCQGTIERVENLMDEAVELAFAQGAQVHFVAPNQTLWDLGRVGALLRYA